MNITPADWKLLFELLDCALEMDESQREAWIEGLDGEALRLKGELKKLLTQHAKVDTAQYLNPYLPNSQSAALNAAAPLAEPDHPATAAALSMHSAVTAARSMPGLASIDHVATLLAAATTRNERRAPSRPNNPAELQVGTVLKNRFILVEEVGSGGMGRVFKARDRVPEAYDDRQPFLAIKVISAEFAQHPDSFKALQREAKRARGLTHENVVKVYDFDQDGGCVYMTMEYLDGRTLQSYLKNEYKNGLSLDKAWPLIRGIGAALEHGHEKRIVHSDLKPGNIFICRDGTVKVLDFGISRPFRLPDDNTEETLFDPSKRLGGLTPAYAALEMWNAAAPDPRDDVYAFACLTYELLTGSHPFGRCSAKQAFESKLTPQRITSLRRPQWEALKRGLALRREERIPSAKELMDALAPASRLKTYGIPLVAAGALASVAAIGIGAYYYRLAVEDSTLAVLQCAAPPTPEPALATEARAPLTPEQTQEVRDLLALAQDYLAEAKPELSVTDLKYILSEGANNVNQIAASILIIDPANADARRLQTSIADIYASKAKSLADAGQPATALEVTREGRKVLPSSQALFRLEQSFCRAAGSQAGERPSM